MRLLLVLVTLAFCSLLRAQNLSSNSSVKYVGFLYYGVISDFGWTFAHDQARINLQQKYRGKIRTAYKENILTSEQTAAALDDFIGKGYQLIIATSYDMMDIVIDYASKYPNVSFIDVSGYKDGPNAANCYAKIYQAYYLAGIISGYMSKSDVFGFIASFPISSVLADLNAFVIGIQKARPNATLKLTMAGTWYDPFTERKNAELLLQRYPTISVFGQEVDSPSVPLVAREAGLYSVGYTTDMRVFVGESVLTSTMFNFAPIYAPYVESVLNGTWLGKNLWTGLETGATALADLSLEVPDHVFEIIQTELKILEAGNDSIFCGPSMVALHNSSNCLTEDEILNMVGYVPAVDFVGNFEASYFIKEQYVAWGSAISIIFGVLAAFGLAFTIVLFVLLVVFRNDKVIRGTSPFFMYFTLLGCLLAYISIFFWIGRPSKDLCNLQFWFGGTAFILVFGCLLAKTFRIWRIFSSLKTLSVVKITDGQLLPMVGVFYLFELVILITWSTYDNPGPVTTKVSDDEIRILCGSNNYVQFGATFFAYKAALMVAAAVLAFLVKDVSSNHNESKAIAFSIYTITIVGAIIVPITITLTSNSNATTILVSIGILISTFVTQVSLFVYKFIVVIGASSNSSSASRTISSAQATVGTGKHSDSSKY